MNTFPRMMLPTAAAAAALASVALGGCTAKTDTPVQTSSGSAAPITVDATDTACTLSATRTGIGKHSFVIINNGTKVTEFYVYGKDNRVLGEAENISPGLRRTLDIEFPEPGTYQAACKPGMVGDGLRTELTVSG